MHSAGNERQISRDAQNLMCVLLSYILPAHTSKNRFISLLSTNTNFSLSDMAKKIIRYLLIITYFAIAIWLLFFFPFTHASRLNPDARRHVILVPATSTVHFIEEAWVHPSERTFREMVMNLFGNLLLMLPLGVLLAQSRWSKRSWPLALLVGLLLSFTVESIQILTHVGNFDVDDILLNTTGAVLGFVLWKQYRKQKQRSTVEY